MILWAFCLIPWASPRDSETSCTTWFIFFFHTESTNLLLRYLIQLWSFEIFNPLEGSVCKIFDPHVLSSHLINENILPNWFILFIILLNSITSSCTICYWIHFITLQGSVSTPIKGMPLFPWTSSYFSLKWLTHQSFFQIWSQANVLPPWRGGCLDSGF